MSVTSLLLDPSIVSTLRPIAPRFPNEIPASLKLPPESRDLALVGQAVDYAIRFELARLNPEALHFPWVARRTVEATLPVLAPELLARATQLLERAERDLHAYVRRSKLEPDERRWMARRCVQLAKLESIYRTGRVREDFESVDEAAVLEIVRILAITPFDQLLSKGPLFLNPTFGPYSTLVGNADADLIAGDTIIDFKTTMKQEIPAEYGLQLASYLILARRARAAGAALPEVRRLGILFTRHGCLLEWDAGQLIDSPAFEHAADEYLKLAAARTRGD